MRPKFFDFEAFLPVAIGITICCFLASLIPLGFAITRSYNFQEGFEAKYKVIILKEKALKVNKENILKESEKLNSALTSPDLLSLKDKEYIKTLIEEVKRTEDILYVIKVSLFNRIVNHNGNCRYWWGGKWVVDLNNFPLLNIQE